MKRRSQIKRLAQAKFLCEAFMNAGAIAAETRKKAVTCGHGLSLLTV